MSDPAKRSDFSESQERALACVLDELIPPRRDGSLPGAGELGLARYIAEEAPGLISDVLEGLAALDELARQRGAEGFASLAREKRPEVLNELAAANPGFLPGLIFHTYVGYYRNARVVEGLGLEARPPHPLGYEIESTDFSLLDGVRTRPRLYRDATPEER